jgi:hypothetical protein
LGQCLAVLRARFGIVRPTFAFPYGELSDELIDVALHLGVTCCLSTRQALVDTSDDPSIWGRFEVNESDSSAALAAKLSGWYSAVVKFGKLVVRPLKKTKRTTGRTAISGRSAMAFAELSRTREALSSP